MTPPPQLRRRATCRRHSTKPITGICASCLRERLAGIDPDTHQQLPVASTDFRRSRSCRSSAAPSSAAEPRRNSCDVRPHNNNNSLSDLFTKDDDGDDCRAQGQTGNEEIRVLREGNLGISLGDDFEGDVEMRPIREFIDLEWERKKVESGRGVNGVASSLLGAASGFSRKLKKWGKKQRMKMPMGEMSAEGGRMGVGRVRFQENLSEVGEYGLGRRSCDVDPRLSLDAGKMSLDGGRCSFDEPRASWDGVLIGRTCPRFSTMTSVAEDVGVRLGSVRGERELMNLGDGENENNPGGSDQTRDYYGELMSAQKRRSFDRSVLNRRIGLVEVESVSNAKVSPETNGLFHGAKLLITEKDLRESNWYSLKEYREENVKSASKDLPLTDGLINHKGLKKSYKWGKVLNLWNLVQKKNEGKCSNDQEKHVDTNMVDMPLAKASKEKVTVAKGGANPDVSQKLIRSYTVRSKNSYSLAGFSDNVSGIESNSNAIKRREDLILQKNRGVKSSPSNLDNSLLRFYVTPPKTSRRNSCGNR